MRPGGRLVALALAGAIASSSGCGRDAPGLVDETSAMAGAPAYGDTFIEATIGDISGLIPNITSDGASHEVGNMVYNGLVKVDKDLNYVGAMAESWQFSADCLDLTFKLKPGIKWHDGRPFTAEDVVFTYQTMINPKTPTAYKEDFLAVKHAEAVDPLHGPRDATRNRYAKALQSWGMWMLPKHLLEQYVRDGKLKESPQNSRPVGTGPYRFQEWKSGEKVVLVANHDYFEGRPYLGRIVYRVIPSQATIFLELKAKGVDLASLTALQYKRQTEYPAFRKAYKKYRYPSSGVHVLRLQSEGSALRRPAGAPGVRPRDQQAGADRRRAAGAGPRGDRAHTGPARWAYTDKVAAVRATIRRRRKALLAEAGWKDTTATASWRQGRQAVHVPIRTNQGNDERKKVAEIIQPRCGSIGVRSRSGHRVGRVPQGVHQEAAVRGDRARLGHRAPIPTSTSSGTRRKTGPDELNHIAYANAEVDELLEEGRASCVQADRVKYYHRLQEILAEDQPLVFLYFRDALPVVVLARARDRAAGADRHQLQLHASGSCPRTAALHRR